MKTGEEKSKPPKKPVDKGNLKKRITELLRGGCAGEVFAESSFSLGGKRIVLDGNPGSGDSDDTMLSRSVSVSVSVCAFFLSVFMNSQ